MNRKYTCAVITVLILCSTILKAADIKPQMPTEDEQQVLLAAICANFANKYKCEHNGLVFKWSESRFATNGQQQSWYVLFSPLVTEDGVTKPSSTIYQCCVLRSIYGVKPVWKVIATSCITKRHDTVSL